MIVSTLQDLPEMLTAEEARAILRLSRNGIYSAIEKSDIPSVRIGRKVLIPKSGIQKLVEQAVSKTV